MNKKIASIILVILFAYNSTSTFSRENSYTDYNSYKEVLKDSGLDMFQIEHLALQLANPSGSYKNFSADNLGLFLDGYKVKEDSYNSYLLLQRVVLRAYQYYLEIDYKAYGELINSLEEEWPYGKDDLLLYLELKIERESVEDHLLSPLGIIKAANFLKLKGLPYREAERVLTTSRYRNLDNMEKIYTAFENLGYPPNEIEEILTVVCVDQFTADILTDLVSSMKESGFSLYSIKEFLLSNKYKSRQFGPEKLENRNSTMLKFLKNELYRNFDIKSWKTLMYMSYLNNGLIPIEEQLTIYNDYKAAFGEIQGDLTYKSVIDYFYNNFSTKMDHNWIKNLVSNAEELSETTEFTMDELSNILPICYLFNTYEGECKRYITDYIVPISEIYGIGEAVDFIDSIQNIMNHYKREETLKAISSFVNELYNMKITLNEISSAFQGSGSQRKGDELPKCISFMVNEFPSLLDYYSIDLLKECFLNENSNYQYEERGFNSLKNKVVILKQLGEDSSIPEDIKKLVVKAIVRNNYIYSVEDRYYPDIVNGIISMEYITEEEKAEFIDDYFSMFDQHSLMDLYSINGFLYQGGFSFSEFYEKYFTPDEIVIDRSRYDGRRWAKDQWRSISYLGNKLNSLQLPDNNIKNFVDSLYWNLTDHHDFQKQMILYIDEIKQFTSEEQVEYIKIPLNILNREPAEKYPQYKIEHLRNINKIIIEKGYKTETAYYILQALSENIYIKDIDSMKNQINSLLGMGYDGDRLKEVFSILYGNRVVLSGDFYSYHYSGEDENDIDSDKSIELTSLTSTDFGNGYIRNVLITPEIYNAFRNVTGLRGEDLEREIVNWAKEHKGEKEVSFHGFYILEDEPSLLSDNPYLNIGLARAIAEAGDRFGQYQVDEKMLEFISSDIADKDQLLYLYLMGIQEISSVIFYMESAGGIDNLRELMLLIPEEDGSIENSLLKYVRLQHSIRESEGISNEEIIKLFSVNSEYLYRAISKNINVYHIVKELQVRLNLKFDKALQLYCKEWFRYRTDSSFNNKFWSVIESETKNDK